MANFKDQFGLDFMMEKRQVTTLRSPDLLPPGLEEALLAYGGKVVGALRNAHDNARSLMQLAEDTSSRIDTLLPVINHLMSKGYITRVAEDSKGNDVYALTETGKKVPA